MTMRKKDYEAIARAINVSCCHTNDPHDTNYATAAYAAAMNNTAKLVSRQIADYCATQDPTFKRERFLADCGVPQ